MDVRTVEEFISKLGPETQKFLEESSASKEGGKSTMAKMKTTAHLGPNFGKPGYSKGPPSPTKKQNPDSGRPIPDSPSKKPDSPLKKQIPGSPVKNRNLDSPSKRPKPDSPVKKASPTRASHEEKSLAATTKRMQLPLVTSKKRSVGDPKEDLSDPDSFYREFKVQV